MKSFGKTRDIEPNCAILHFPPKFPSLSLSLKNLLPPFISRSPPFLALRFAPVSNTHLCHRSSQTRPATFSPKIFPHFSSLKNLLPPFMGRSPPFLTLQFAPIFEAQLCHRPAPDLRRRPDRPGFSTTQPPSSLDLSNPA
jgi:hypothetical protein